jgi:hypothetical protein
MHFAYLVIFYYFGKWHIVFYSVEYSVSSYRHIGVFAVASMLIPMVLLSVTSAAHAIRPATLGSPDSRVFGAIGMSPWAVRFSDVIDASVATPNVFLLGDSLQVRRVETSPIAAQVVYLHTTWLWPVTGFVGKVMAVESLWLAIDGASANAVAIDFGSRPDPTFIGPVGKRSHTFVEVHSRYHNNNMPVFISGVNLRGTYGA